MKTITEIINDAWLAGYKEGYKTDYQKPEKAKKNMANNYATEVVNKNDLLPDVSQRSELLAFVSWYNCSEQQYLRGWSSDVVVREYLKANCG